VSAKLNFKSAEMLHYDRKPKLRSQH